MTDVRSEEMLLNIGPQHPSTHGVLRIVVRTDGEVILDSDVHVGYLHRCYEKIAENVDYKQVVPYTDRMDYLAAMLMNWGYCLTVEELAEIEISDRAERIRVVIGELQRVASHLMAIGTYGLDVGAITAFLYCFRDREKLLKIFETVSGQRLNYTYIRPGGVAQDLTDEMLDDIRWFCDYYAPKIDEIENLFTYNGIFINRTAEVGVITPEIARDWAITGPNARGAGIDRDLRRDAPYSLYEQLYEDGVFEIPVCRPGEEEIGVVGDCWNRYKIRVEEVRESLKIIRHLIGTQKNPKPLPEGDFMNSSCERRVRVPKGEVYSRIESSRGELHHYLVSNGRGNPYRLKARSPGFCNIAVVPEISRGCMVADMIAIIGSIDIVMGEVDR